MVNLAFCRLDVFLSDHSWHSEAQHSSISIYIPSAGRSFMLEFLSWSFKNHLIWCFPNSMVFGSSAVRTSFPGKIIVFADLRGDQLNYRRLWIMIRFAGCFGITMDFFKQPRASVQIEARSSTNFLRFSDVIGRFCLLLCLCIILTWNPIDYLGTHFLLVVHQRIYCFGISSLCL